MVLTRRLALSVIFSAIVAAAALESAASQTQSRIAFVTNSHYGHHDHARYISISSSSSKSGRLGRHSAPTYSSHVPLFQSKSGNNNEEDLFLLNIDALASRSLSTSWMAVCVALKVWPTLQSNMEALGMDPHVFDWEQCNKDDVECSREIFLDESPHEWLLQKLSALSSITQQGNSPDAMLGCDAVLLARVLLEEQVLDAGRSNGRGGKYGGKFHPSSSDADGGAGQHKSKVGSRPLTVGELFANWPELRDVTRIKYPHIEEQPDGKLKRQDPLPMVRQYMKEIMSNNNIIVPSWQSLAYDVLFDYSKSISSPHERSNDDNDSIINLRENTMILLGHDAQIPLAVKALTSLLGCDLNVELDVDIPGEATKAPCTCINNNYESDGMDMKVVVTTSDKAKERLVQGLLLVVPDPQRDETHSSMIERIVSGFYVDSKSGLNRNVFVVHSSLEVLKQCKSFLGDDVPILSQGLRKCILPRSNTAVTLFLPEWADSVHPTQQNDGEMDPWLNLVSEEQIVELISARITEAPLV